MDGLFCGHMYGCSCVHMHLVSNPCGIVQLCAGSRALPKYGVESNTGVPNTTTSLHDSNLYIVKGSRALFHGGLSEALERSSVRKDRLRRLKGNCGSYFIY